MNRGQSFLLLLIGSVALLTLFVIRPFIEYVIASAILAYVLFPFHVRLSRGFKRDSPTDSASRLRVSWGTCCPRSS